ncbi:GDP-L-fucose synthase [Burkholderia pseudomultivorans]|uniref:GDP-L-fucose synthase n=1 Tax=Burkholderia pseudomultivorans TaxID=1207504 RepID=UPI0001FD9F19|nr:GDP-L-fucose synthase [Burkholderia pseudomultivorans]EGD03964.1 NAD-dependent epimerase/dehydratase [Burkholderia sp. TJI49]AOI90416.1 GDP-fucose synthetase [Burkholderia pseudomultivorans]KVC18111.1 GDP-fucose synthetase [Burkholderia pseudomultivorans]KVC32986.1 GDP-fucose synthetase [Burkholderia pseudomultivorans]KVC57284.1 GDP-fucose synthetase [Burkholderia pseudomultivorans]
MNTSKRIFVAGHRGMVGSAIVRRLAMQGQADIVTRSRHELDLTDQHAVGAFFAENAIDEVYLAAAKVGGIYANSHYPADFIYENMMMQANVIHHAYKAGVKRLLFLGSSCIYPKFAEQPIREDYLMTGKLEPTNEPYAIAKISGIKMCESYSRQYGVDYRSVMPTNLYGPGDNYHPDNSHVIPALLRRFHEAKVDRLPAVRVWGSGKPLREFLYVDDLAAASVLVMDLPADQYRRITGPMESHINVGTGEDVTIADLAALVADVVGYSGALEFDASKPDGTPRKLLDISKLRSIGYRPEMALGDGLRRAYDDFLHSAQRK